MYICRVFQPQSATFYLPVNSIRVARLPQSRQPAGGASYLESFVAFMCLSTGGAGGLEQRMEVIGFWKQQ